MTGILGLPLSTSSAVSGCTCRGARVGTWRRCVLRASSVLAGGKLDMDVWEFYEETRVRFSQLSEELLWEYIHSGEPM